jgi:hypothetical protein
MKQLGRTVTLFVATVLLTVAGYAQYAPMTLKADVPFAFSIGNQTFSAGQYFIVRTSPQTLVLRDGRDKVLTTIVAGQVQSRDAHDHSSLRFRTEDGRHVLAEVWQSGTNIGYQIYVPKPSPVLVKDQRVNTQVAAQSNASPASTR